MADRKVEMKKEPANFQVLVPDPPGGPEDERDGKSDARNPQEWLSR